MKVNKITTFGEYIQSLLSLDTASVNHQRYNKGTQSFKSVNEKA